MWVLEVAEVTAVVVVLRLQKDERLLTDLSVKEPCVYV